MSGGDTSRDCEKKLEKAKKALKKLTDALGDCEETLEDALETARRRTEYYEQTVRELRALLRAAEDKIEEMERSAAESQRHNDEVSADNERRRVALESREAALAQELERLQKDRIEVNTLKPDLELLSKETERKIVKEVQLLADLFRGNDKLVGRHNTKQKIQYHIELKEENNRLMKEVLQLTEEKFRLECRLGKISRAFGKDKIDQVLALGTRGDSPAS